MHNGDKGQLFDQNSNIHGLNYPFQVDSRTIGMLGEDIAVRWLKRNSFTIVQRSYRLSFGEIDIIAARSGTMYYIEVKSIQIKDNVSRETYQPWNNLSRLKVKTIIACAHYHRREKQFHGKYQIDALCVWIDVKRRTARVERMENINIR